MGTTRLEQAAIFVLTIILGAAIFQAMEPEGTAPGMVRPDQESTSPAVDAQDQQELERLKERVARNYSLDTVEVPSEGCDQRPGVYNTQPSNVTDWNFNPRPYVWRSNSEGWRETQEFDPEPPDNVTRILVLGDSFTFGTGVNDSYTYPAVLEQRLQQYGQYQVINAGVPGSGMRDYCSMLEHRGLRYNPDLVVVTFTYYDAIWRKHADDIYGEVIEILPWNQETINESVLREYGGDVKGSLYTEMVFNETAALPVYMERIQRMATSAGAETVFYSFRQMDDQVGRANDEVSAIGFLEGFMAEHNMTWIRSPPAFEDRPLEEYTLSDGHYDEWGYRQLGVHLAYELWDRGIIGTDGS